MVHAKVRSMRGVEKWFELFVWLMGLLVFVVTLYPLWFVVIASLSEPGLVSNGKVWLFPKGLNIDGFLKVFQDNRIWTGYRTTMFVTAVGTALSMAVTIPCAYALSRKDFKIRRPLMLFFIFTMYFNGGLIPTYIIISQKLGFDNSIWVMIIPFCMNVYNLIVCRSFFENTLPPELLESARLDGCSNTRFFFSIALPLSKAILSVITLYYVVLRWNDYFTALIYVRDESIKPLQIVLRNILLMNEAMQGANSYASSESLRLTELIKYSSIIVSTLPVLILYPFIQKYFEKGVMIGALKG
jgi:putative aldouronate transport system permease protein